MTDTSIVPIGQSSPSIEQLISQGLQQGSTPETMEKLLDLYERIEAKRAKQAYDAAMSQFQAECPTIKKTKLVRTKSGDDAYRYAPIEKIIEQIKPLLIKYGFSHSAEMEMKPNSVRVTMKVTHSGGHCEVSNMEVPYGTKTAVMSDTQVTAAAVTFARRHAFSNAFGILTSDQDTDARLPSEDKYFNVVKVVADDGNNRTILYCENEIINLNRGFPHLHLPLTAPYRVKATVKATNEQWGYNGRKLPVFASGTAEMIEDGPDE